MSRSSQNPIDAGTWSRRLSLWGPVVLYCALIFGLSSVSDVPSLPGGLSDKTAHAALYTGLGFLMFRAMTGTARRRTWGLALVCILTVTLYGLSDEGHQLFVPHRQFDLKDLLADMSGASIGTVARWLWGIIRS